MTTIDAAVLALTNGFTIRKNIALLSVMISKIGSEHWSYASIINSTALMWKGD